MIEIHAYNARNYIVITSVINNNYALYTYYQFSLIVNLIEGNFLVNF